MELRSLRYFVEVVKQKSFTGAAEKMFVTQPTISKMVKSLEDEIGSPLLLRESRQMLLTDAGQIVYQRGLEVLAAHAQLEAELNDLGKLGRGTLAIGIPPMGGSLFTPAIATFKKRYPKVELKLFERGSKAIEAALIDGELELGGVLEPVDFATFDVLPISRQLLWLVAQKGSGCAGGRAARRSRGGAVRVLRRKPGVIGSRAQRLQRSRVHADYCGAQRPLGFHGRAGAGGRRHCVAACSVLPAARCQRIHLPAGGRAGNSLGHGGGLAAQWLFIECGARVAGGCAAITAGQSRR
jgi:DNA-binding transcriptional LysR family regulator